MFDYCVLLENFTPKVVVTPSVVSANRVSIDGRMKYVWVYNISMENHSNVDVQLIKRKWFISDSSGFTTVVAGDGVIGQQPILKPGHGFEYTSFADLSVKSGSMCGEYIFKVLLSEIDLQKKDENGDENCLFTVPIPNFFLAEPGKNDFLKKH